MNPKRIVITGGPSTGKTSLIDALEKDGYQCFHEVIRLMTLKAKQNGELGNLTTNPIATVSDPMAFNEKIIDARLTDYNASENSDAPIVFFDRGIPDVLAYMDYFKQTYDEAFVAIAANHRYDTVFLLPIWKEIYVSDSERFESYEEALAIHRHLKESYTALGYGVIEVPKATVENRIAFILTQLEAN
ncbi:ATP-binding protein [Aggregatimonas sangjinii]|uniref:ATP-binding protein n=1 Tax=Aggregatimonas sangjinii TaxID=2583587 RepID=A0A5B7SRR4_9FLAO|nr:ATP-binding protein [Aggregatimonas sangjinii]QCW99712.1 ATP-binding protein [Aggregatimonas sangjinii]